ncbi:RuBisCO large subunit C-terminal-like domain-containing protein [Ectothiorhodospira lacustris]|uniref:RuBisCO large subunit C-terminal-like domain-containing protein n=1 Tax=Ectothiorhodospira lacustris TaxID=2899127 RepID=UPI001EE79D14|nr:RuBisCO large subunit C-terminal-like domain-containing protein [Ectothiorhodospira lacustris]MCG5500944.1 RuBisCO large subunit C-terminal-like domain-containing protein [Ectothiorhodospira lacustris]MCG5510693.1 RuBisCO large subunit C-terminal-like domain-containing protein [Ectothiorhodospira lacustris]MCG5522407.1 RuBisCO large subunit C-terminal-like domain-containing protein [Ectothiorhodospira lacustris]
MQPADIEGFFADPANLDLDRYLILDYELECVGDPRPAVAHLCSEQSTAQWKRVDVDEDLRPRFAAKVIEMEVLEEREALSYPVTHAGEGRIFACRVRIAHPHENFGPRIPNLLSAVCGEGPFFTPGIPLIKLMDIHFPEVFLRAFQGPKFGVQGLRELLNAHDRPIFLGVIKPNIGLPPAAFSAIASEAWLGGLDIAKDDEMLADPDWSPLDERCRHLGEARRRAEQETGTPKMYMANITDEVDRLIELHDIAVARGANALLVNAMPVGLSAVRMLRKHTQVPLFGHFPFIAAFSRLPHYGIHSRVITRLQRLAGYDSVIMPGFGPRMMTSDEEVMANVRACLEDMGPIKPCLPVPGGSDSAATLQRVYEKVGSVDFGFVPGRGVFGHTMGPRGGAASIRQAWDALARGMPVPEQARQHPELAAALKQFQ